MENERVISQKEEEQLAKQEGIQYFFEISSKEDVELLLKKIACLCLKNKNLIDIKKEIKNKKPKKVDCISF